MERAEQITFGYGEKDKIIGKGTLCVPGLPSLIFG